MLVGGNTRLPITRTFIAVGLSLGAAFCYGIGGVFVSAAFKNEQPLTLAIGQQLAAGLDLLPVAVFLLPHAVPAPTVIAAVLGLALLSTSLAYLLYFHLMRGIGPVKTLSVTFLVPVFGVLWGRIFLHEPLSAGMLGGLLVILVSVALVTNVPVLWRRTGRPGSSGMSSD
ncbi:MAG: DMT family transporter [Thermaerobacter sp.]|nr:DMT family transporter [Thermaerobacter sp.]